MVGSVLAGVYLNLLAPLSGFIGWIVGALEITVLIGGLSIVGAVLYNLRIPKDSILRYERDIMTGKYVLIVNGMMFDTTFAKETLNQTQPQILDHHEHSAADIRAYAKA